MQIGFKKFSNKCPFDDHIYGITVTVERSFNYIQKYNTSSHKKGETVKFSKRLYLHLFLNESKVCDAHVILNRELDGLKSLIEQGAELSESAQRRADKYFTITRRKDKIKAAVKLREIVAPINAIALVRFSSRTKSAIIALTTPPIAPAPCKNLPTISI